MECKTKKKCYIDENQAVEAAVYLSLKAKQYNHPELYPYKCNKCDYWHITSKSTKTRKQKQIIKKERKFIELEANNYFKQNRKQLQKQFSL